jgi:hypothetical protein
MDWKSCAKIGLGLVSVNIQHFLEDSGRQRKMSAIETTSREKRLNKDRKNFLEFYPLFAKIETNS